MLWRARSAQARSKIAPPGFIQPPRRSLSKKPPTGELWVHEVKHDGYRLQVHVRAGRVRLYTMNERIGPSAIGVLSKRRHGSGETLYSTAKSSARTRAARSDFDRLHSRCFDHRRLLAPSI